MKCWGVHGYSSGSTTVNGGLTTKATATASEPLHPLVIRAPPFLLEQGRDSPISIAAIFTGQRDDPCPQSVLALKCGWAHTAG